MSVHRCWRTFDSDIFRTDLPTSVLCNVTSYGDLDCDALASLYDTTVQELLHRQVSARTVTCRRRPSSVWFDDECRRAKQSVRSLEGTVRRDGMVHCQPLPRRLPPRGALNDVLTSTCSVRSDRLSGRNGSTPISHILIVYGGLLMNFSAVVGRRLRISTPRIYIATSTTRLPEFALLLPVLIHHHSRRAQSEACLSRSASYDRRRLGARTDAA